MSEIFKERFGILFFAKIRKIEIVRSTRGFEEATAPTRQNSTKI